MFEQEFETPGDALAHFGVKGQKWGVRKAMPPAGLAGVPNKTNKLAKKHAEEFTKAKAFFGEGAGTRRKLIKAQVEQLKKQDPMFAKAFDHHVAQTDHGQRAVEARKERKSVDRKTATKKTAKGVGHVLRGNNQHANNAAIAGVAAATFVHKTGLDKQALNKVKTNPAVHNLLKKHGLA